VKTALIADVHGNLVALEAVLADIERRGAERVVCLGDVAATGPQPCEVIARLRELECPVVMGNTDQWLLDPTDDGDDDEDSHRIVEIDLWVRDQLEARDLAYLQTFPPLIELGWLLCYHGSPRSNEDVIVTTTPEAELERMLGGHAEQVLAGGHTHVQMLRRHNHSLVINPGSVGMPYERLPDGTFHNPPWAEYAVVRRGRIEFRRVPLDVRAVAGAALESGMPHAGWWVKDWSWSEG
jgi:putative phosphoesterase